MYAVFADTNSYSRSLSILNSQHNDINFTMEKANKMFNILDVEIELNNVGLKTCVWRKSTNTELMLNFFFYLSINLEIRLN